MVGYCRTSKEDPNDNKISILLQEDAIKEYAHQNNIELIEVFKEPNVSGKLYLEGKDPNDAVKELLFTWEGSTSRKEFAKVIKLVDQRTIDGVICHEPTRLCHSVFNSSLTQAIIDVFRVNTLNPNHKEAVELHFYEGGQFDYMDQIKLNIFNFTQGVNSRNLKAQHDKMRKTLQDRRDCGLKDRSVECLGIRDGKGNQGLQRKSDGRDNHKRT